MCDLQDQKKNRVRILRRRTVYEVFHNLSYNKAMKNEEYNETSICYLLSSFFLTLEFIGMIQQVGP